MARAGLIHGHQDVARMNGKCFAAKGCKFEDASRRNSPDTTLSGAGGQAPFTLASRGRSKSKEQVMSKPVSYIELHTSDPAKAKSFYGQLFSWRFEELQIPGMQ